MALQDMINIMTTTNYCNYTTVLFKLLFSRIGQLKCVGTRAENRFRLSVKRASPFKSAGESV